MEKYAQWQKDLKVAKKYIDTTYTIPADHALVEDF